MERSIIIAGFGGQGVMLIGQLLGLCAYEDGMHATFFPSYGPEQRGGTANCMVVIGREEVGFPLADSYDLFVPMNQVSLLKYQDKLASGGILVADQSLSGETIRQDVTALFLPMNDLAVRAGSPKTVNLVVLGTLCQRLGAFRYQAVERAVTAKLGKKKELLPANLAALKAGWDYAAAH